MLNFKDHHSSGLMSPRSALSQPQGGIIGHSTRYNANNNDVAVDNMIGDIKEEEDKEEEDVDKDGRSLNPSPRPKSRASNAQEAFAGSSQVPEAVHAPEASL